MPTNSISTTMAVALLLVGTVLDTAIESALAFDLWHHSTIGTKRRTTLHRLQNDAKVTSGHDDESSTGFVRATTSKSRSWNGQQEEEMSDTTTTTNIRPPRSVDYPPFVAKTGELADYDDESNESDLLELMIRHHDRHNTTGNVSHVKIPRRRRQRAPRQKPWWSLSIFSENFPLDFGPIQKLQKSTEETRLRNDRSYARKGSFQGDRLRQPPGLYDLSTPPCPPRDAFWISIPARFLSYTVAYYAFPYCTKFVDSFVTLPHDKLDDIAANFGPGISILYGTFISLTLSILYNRQRSIQETVSIECSNLALLTQRIISLLQKKHYQQQHLLQSNQQTLQAGQAIADQIRMLAQSSRGKELMVLMYTDPYARLSEVLDDYEEETSDNRNDDDDDGPRYAGQVAQCREIIKDLYRIRANRLSDESLALSPTHFFILNLLTLMMLAGFTVSIIPTVDLVTATPSNESCLLFALLSTIYLLFYNFAADLNGPFQGVYQIRRSTAAGHLLQMRWFLANHPVLAGNVDFTEPKVDPQAKAYRIATPNLGDFWFEEK